MSTATVDLCLASASPRRQELLQQLGFRFALLRGIDVDETPRAGEGAAALAERLARAKALAGWERAGPRDRAPVLGADTVVVAGRRILGKPADRADFVAMLGALGGRDHQVLTAVAVTDGERLRTRLSRTRVRMRRISHAELDAYWATGEPADKAGGYAIQGHAAAFIARIEGSYSGVMGLPLYETAQLLAGFGVRSALHHANDNDDSRASRP